MKTFNFRVHRHGNKLTLTLPHDWCRTNQVKAGGTLIIALNEIMPYKLIIHSFSGVDTNYIRLKSLTEDYTATKYIKLRELIS